MTNTGTEVTSRSPETVMLIINFSNGAQKRFADIPWTPEMSVIDVLEAAGQISPGLVFEFTVTLDSDRSGRQGGIIASIDGVKADEPNQNSGGFPNGWMIRINDRRLGDDIRVVTEESLSGPIPEVKAGDIIELRQA